MTDTPTPNDGLPDSFTLEIERKPGGYWFVGSPEYRGLFICAPGGLDAALADVPTALSALLRLDGVSK